MSCDPPPTHARACTEREQVPGLSVIIHLRGKGLREDIVVFPSWHAEKLRLWEA